MPNSLEPLPQVPRPEPQGVACTAAATELGLREDPSGARSVPASPRTTAGRAVVQASSGRSANSGATAAFAGGRAGDDASTCRTEPQQDPCMGRPAGGLAEERHSPARAAGVKRRHPASYSPKQHAQVPSERPPAALDAGAAGSDAPETGRSALPGAPVPVEGACGKVGVTAATAGGRAGDDASIVRDKPQEDACMGRPASGLAGEHHSPARAAGVERRHPASQRPKQHAQAPAERRSTALAVGAAGSDAPEVGRSTLPSARAPMSSDWFLPATPPAGQEPLVDSMCWHSHIAFPPSMGGKGFNATAFVTDSGRRGRLFPAGAHLCKQSS